MESPALRMIVIGSSLFMAMLTISALLLYYNTAKNLADVSTNRTDIAENYKLNNVFSLDEGTYTVNGLTVRNIVRQAVNNKDVIINIGTEEDIAYCSRNERYKAEPENRDPKCNDIWIDSIGNISEAKLEEKFQLQNDYTFELSFDFLREIATITIN